MKIEVHGLAKTFRVGLRSRKIEAVKDVSLSVRDNEIFGLVGPNGAGKSTTLHIVLGLLRPTRGRGTVLGKPLGSIEARRQLGYLPELPNFYGYLKARELLEMVGLLSGMGRADLTRRVPELLEQVGLQHKGDNLLSTFSKGMLQRLGLAQALVSDPDLVILDEPMSGLDPMGRLVVRNTILDLKTRGKTVLFSSHILPDVEALCDRVALISGGRCLVEATVDELVSRNRSSFEVMFTGAAPPEEILGASAQRRAAGEQQRIVVEDQQRLYRLVDWVRENGELLAVTPVRESLEDVIVQRLATSDGTRSAS